MLALRRPNVTEEEFASLPVTVYKTELVDGEVIVTPSPDYAHQKLNLKLASALERWAEVQEESLGPLTVLAAPMDVRLGPNRIVQPDLMVLFREIPFGHRGPILHVPELCVEILSGNPAYDRITKRMLYAEAGVREFWVIDPLGLPAEKWMGPGLRLKEDMDPLLTSELLPGFSLDLRALLTHYLGGGVRPRKTPKRASSGRK